jgi:hypothetical protein
VLSLHLTDAVQVVAIIRKLKIAGNLLRQSPGLAHLTGAVYLVDISVRNLQKYLARSCDSPPDWLTPVKIFWESLLFLFWHSD